VRGYAETRHRAKWRRTQMPVSLKDILEAYEFVRAGGDEHQAFLCKQSGKVYWHSEHSDELDDPLPDDIGNSEKYLQISDKRELDLGKPLALDFARKFLPCDFDEVRQLFSRRGAYARFKFRGES